MGFLKSPTVDAKTLLRRTGIALVLALGVNLVILTVVLALDVLPEYEALAYPPVTTLTTGGVVGGAVVYALLDRVSKRPNRLFTWMALAVLLLSFVPNVSIYQSEEAATVGIVLVLIGLHVPPALTTIISLTGRMSSLSTA